MNNFNKKQENTNIKEKTNSIPSDLEKNTEENYRDSVDPKNSDEIVKTPIIKEDNEKVVDSEKETNKTIEKKDKETKELKDFDDEITIKIDNKQSYEITIKLKDFIKKYTCGNYKYRYIIIEDKIDYESVLYLLETKNNIRISLKKVLIDRLVYINNINK